MAFQKNIETHSFISRIVMDLPHYFAGQTGNTFVRDAKMAFCVLICMLGLIHLLLHLQMLGCTV